MTGDKWRKRAAAQRTVANVLELPLRKSSALRVGPVSPPFSAANSMHLADARLIDAGALRVSKRAVRISFAHLHCSKVRIEEKSQIELFTRFAAFTEPKPVAKSQPRAAVKAG